MKKLNKNEKILLSLCGALVIIYGYYSLFFSPIQSKISDIKTQIVSNSNAVNNINIVKSLNKKQSDQLSKLQVKYDEAAKALPKSERNPEISYDIKKAADDSKVTLNTITLGKGVEYKQQAGADNKNTTQSNNSNGGLMLLPVTINISGDYLNMVSFIANVENNKRIAEISNVNISSTNNGTSQASININYYYLNSSSIDNKYDFNTGSYGKDNLFK